MLAGKAPSFSTPPAVGGERAAPALSFSNSLGVGAARFSA
jgi:hypothetical protein